MQAAVVIEYAFEFGESFLHNYALQLMDDVRVPASFIGIGPSSRDFILPKAEVRIADCIDTIRAPYVQDDCNMLGLHDSNVCSTTKFYSKPIMHMIRVAHVTYVNLCITYG